MTLRDEVTALLQSLVRLDTVNPPGNETRAAELLAGYLAENGVESQLYARVPERANLVARIPGGDGPTLAFLCHTDTVLADPGEWDRDPWSGDLVDGEVWGRGALDMKGQVAANAVAFASLAREGFVPSGDLLFIATADEEVGDGYGLVWLCSEHPDAVRCDYAVNEGGGERLVLGGKPVYLCASAEKASAPFVVRVHGRSGHASMPGIADNALVKSARYLEALGSYAPPIEEIPEARGLLEAVLGEMPPLDDALERASAIHPMLPALVEPLLSFTLSPTMIDASHQRNVIPAQCVITVDCRLLPETTPADVEPLIRAALGDGSYDIEFQEYVGGTRSPLDTPLWKALARFTEKIEPDARLAPMACPGFTDSHFLRETFGTVAYGYFPALADPMELTKMVHSANERARVEDLELGTNMLRATALELLGQ
ncbi:MAG TPA: M20/M25/M40 family metallo-hydrolase [Gaiellaceae bacterium]|jgi:acetylornithine deacetylase/succinyl-diaminopimelate desuccinylase-like protein|nr:M20/M25/M40 family metallo-hydrolase [Gaiellaceae bacterium]